LMGLVIFGVVAQVISAGVFAWLKRPLAEAIEAG